MSITNKGKNTKKDISFGLRVPQYLKEIVDVLAEKAGVSQNTFMLNCLQMQINTPITNNMKCTGKHISCELRIPSNLKAIVKEITEKAGVSQNTFIVNCLQNQTALLEKGLL